MKYSLLILALVVMSQARAKVEAKSLANFRPGVYALEKGDIDLCDEGDFYLRDNGANVALGEYHGFDTIAKSEAVPGDAPGDEGCMYLAENEVEVKGAETLLRFQEERTCKKVRKHLLKKTATIRKELIKVDVQQTGENARTYSCVWKFKKSAGP